ncbi:MAG: sigma-70 family RNA polymerase sigma factor [Deltaproteobacteria bacterium]|nr:sigma-70 family RNA polymerase sigma factor [Deltaproteobacteria bacterium]
METRESSELGDEKLVALARSGQRGAFELLMERYKQKAYRIAFDFTRDREEAKDLSQEAFLRAYIHLKDFDQRASFYTWFYRILVNLCLDHRRRGKRISWQSLEDKNDKVPGAGEVPDNTSSPDEEAIAEELSRKVLSALAALPPRQRTAFILKNHQGLAIHEIAKVMQTAEGTVKAHLHRAVVTLRQSLAEPA